jgi:Trk K+ transport system NAD-binding subunit
MKAKALLSVTSDDLTNLEIALNARALSPAMRVILRIYDPSLAASLRERLDIYFAFSMSTIAADALNQLAEGVSPTEPVTDEARAEKGLLQMKK